MSDGQAAPVDAVFTWTVADTLGTISGTVSKSGGAGPLVGAYVTAYDATTASWTNYAITDGVGGYNLTLPQGSYKLLIQTNDPGYADGWYGGTTFANATVVVVDGAEVVDITVASSYAISGTVSKSGGAGPLVGAYVTAYDATTASWTNYAITDGVGGYNLTLPQGNYKLLIQTNDPGYADGWYGGTTFANATVVVVDGAEVVDITVASSYAISGTVSKSGGAGPLVGAYVTAYDATTASWTNYAITDGVGGYNLTLPQGNYKLLIQTNDPGYADGWYGGTTFANATVVVVDGAEVVDITVASSYAISGTVSKSGGAGPLVGAYVTAYDATTASWTNYAITDGVGGYNLTLPQGSYKLLIQTNDPGYADGWYGGTTFANATVVVVDGAEVVDITVASSYAISGTVSKSGGAGPLVGAYVTAYDATTASWTNYAITDGVGGYNLTLPQGSYKLLIQTNDPGYADGWYGGTTFANATVVVVDGAEVVDITVASS